MLRITNDKSDVGLVREFRQLHIVYISSGFANIEVALY